MLNRVSIIALAYLMLAYQETEPETNSEPALDAWQRLKACLKRVP